jgi:hypothetical protein
LIDYSENKVVVVLCKENIDLCLEIAAKYEGCMKCGDKLIKISFEFIDSFFSSYEATEKELKAYDEELQSLIL